jgi:hypothetical protein
MFIFLSIWIASMHGEDVCPASGKDSRALSMIGEDISPNAWQHVHLIGAFDFEQTESQIDIDALAARYDDPDFWNRALIEAPDDSLA